VYISCHSQHSAHAHTRNMKREIVSCCVHVHMCRTRKITAIVHDRLNKAWFKALEVMNDLLGSWMKWIRPGHSKTQHNIQVFKCQIIYKYEHESVEGKIIISRHVLISSIVLLETNEYRESVQKQKTMTKMTWWSIRSTVHVKWYHIDLRYACIDWFFYKHTHNQQHIYLSKSYHINNTNSHYVVHNTMWFYDGRIALYRFLPNNNIIIIILFIWSIFL